MVFFQEFYRTVCNAVYIMRVMLRIRNSFYRFIGDHIFIKTLFIGIERFRFRRFLFYAQVPFAKYGGPVSIFPEKLKYPTAPP